MINWKKLKHGCGHSFSEQNDCSVCLRAELALYKRVAEAAGNEHFRHRCDHKNPCSLCVALAALPKEGTK